MRQRRVSFLVLGSARSGTTLVQRLACELPGVSIPPETHFFEAFASELLSRRSFPLTEIELREEVDLFLRLETSKGMSIDPDCLRGGCESPFELFEIIVGCLTGPADLLGEKTPGHTLWWEPILRASPEMKFVVVVRDPRAVVASSLSMPWASNEDLNSIRGQLHLGVAARWRVDQQAISQLRQAVGPRQCLLMRYEEVANDPDGARMKIGSLLGVDGALDPDRAPAPGIVLDWEPWKAQALEDVTDDRLNRPWTESLSYQQVQQIEAVCRRSMHANGYLSGRMGPAIGAVRLDRSTKREIEAFVKKYDDYRRYIGSMDLGVASSR